MTSWKIYAQDSIYIKAKFTCSEDYTMAFLDILNTKDQNNHLLTKFNPIMFNIYGEGNFSRPFFISPKDPMVLTFIAFFIKRQLDNKNYINDNNHHFINSNHIVDPREVHQN